MRKRVNELHDQEDEKLEVKDVPNIKYEDTSQVLSQKLVEEIEAVLRESDETEIRSLTLFKAIYRMFKC